MREIIASLAIGVAIILLGLFLLLIFSPPVTAGTCKGRMVQASWYGQESGSRTASGKFFDGSQLLIAHKTLKFGTRVRLTYRGKSIVVPVEDRGPYIKGREVDMSAAVAKRIGAYNAGVVRLCMEVLQ